MALPNHLVVHVDHLASLLSHRSAKPLSLLFISVAFLSRPEQLPQVHFPVRSPVLYQVHSEVLSPVCSQVHQHTEIPPTRALSCQCSPRTSPPACPDHLSPPAGLRPMHHQLIADSTSAHTDDAPRGQEASKSPFGGSQRRVVRASGWTLGTEG
jgi:hypothetical protein